MAEPAIQSKTDHKLRGDELFGEMVPVQRLQAKDAFYTGAIAITSIDKDRQGIARLSFSPRLRLIYIRESNGHETVLPLENIRSFQLVMR